MARPIGIDLFAGAGGLSLGFEQAGFDIAAAVEIDPIHCATHEYNFPKCKTICASVINLTGQEIRALSNLQNREIDVVFGGAPCQGFSMIGKRALDDQRNQLVFHYVRLVRELQPKYCVFENVKGLTLGKHAQFLEELIDALKDAGYSVLLPYKVLNAADYGVPQSRERLFLMAARNGESMPIYPATCTESITVRDAISDLPDADQFDRLKKSDSVLVEWTTSSTYARRLRGQLEDPSNYGYKRAFDANLLTCSLITEHTAESKERFLATSPGSVEKISRFLRLSLDGVCNTLRAGTDSARGAHTSPRPIHPVYSRVLTVREAARLHSYPDWFRMHVTKWHGFRQIGNSVPPILGRAVASSIISALGVQPTRPRSALKLGSTSLLSMNMGEAAAYFAVSRSVIAQRTRKVSEAQNESLLLNGVDEEQDEAELQS
ncbi:MULTISPECIES: DNA cytosine methyltransferase [unclassified Herbaspirillum]|uniref:DNA cytosine methyltransferase n=1 Tax=unclassified Herbaspirillum TaxID=2624150 RepID=UPI0011542DBE|nr:MULTISPECIES: DNA cytosine methyltransferase [unclassified Herbaspirillum]MBB5393924.1 DNA (cytosine-5)-methyltransferase 1 [Herbaspirillum sp. SJZ102]TQK00038.1 DNA (cytosine-5)-methyltransferase 1 [Herbaspirillum sp. SJZ130]TQK04638.1 DNA (cytosine-5)-methyltransferase 1 [Herbaspirillum sp. SJZ106]